MSVEPRRFVPTRSFLERDVGDEYLLFDATADRLYVLNATAREIYLLCAERGEIRDVVTEMVRRYDVLESTAARDVATLVERLLEAGVLRPDRAAG